MSVYSEYRHWSPTLGCDAVRLSMVDERGGEFYRIIPVVSGRGWRAARDEALEVIEDAIIRGAEPGEVSEVTE